ncbi:MAG TPA: LLM class F420-dependent oxidoreductase [Mycobacteriales bacterium]|nr:LLM class F420-dependent oxidoreductase [Mycobacteriales bacterium]
MKLALTLPYAEGALTRDQVLEVVRAADRLGYDSLWVAEAWSYDAFMVLTSLIPETQNIKLATGIVNVYSRTPSLIAQSAATLDALSGGRAILGLGASGPQVIKGWHGLDYDQPLQRTREVIDIVRMIMRRDKLEYSGEVFDLQGRLKLINHPVRPSIPIAVASLGPKNVAMTAEMADAWLPTLYSPAKAAEVFGPPLAEGASRRSADLAPLEVVAPAAVAISDDPANAKNMARMGMALYIGGMGSRKQNFYNQLFQRYGYAAEAAEIQDLYLSGKQPEAIGKVTDAMVDEVSIIGSAGYVKDRLAQFAEAGVSTLLVQIADPDPANMVKTLEQLAELN